MTFAVHVRGGTGAGSKRPLREKPGPWRCKCPPEGETFALMRPGYLKRCTACGADRP